MNLITQSINMYCNHINFHHAFYHNYFDIHYLGYSYTMFDTKYILHAGELDLLPTFFNLHQLSGFMDEEYKVWSFLINSFRSTCGSK